MAGARRADRGAAGGGAKSGKSSVGLGARRARGSSAGEPGLGCPTDLRGRPRIEFARETVGAAVE